MPDKILEEDHLRTIPLKFDSNWPSSFRKEDFLIHQPPFVLFSVMAAIMDGRSGCQILKGDHPRTIQNLVKIGKAVSVDGRMRDAKSSPGLLGQVS